MPSAPNRIPAGRILLVDDNDMGLVARSELLAHHGHQIFTSHTPQAALDLISTQNYDVIVTDYKMPGMNGVEFIRQLRALNATVPVILISGFTDPLGLKPENTGANAVIQKSNHEVSHLVREIRRLLTPKASGSKKPPGSAASKRSSAKRKAAE